jgi:hypothetical protein
MNAAMWAAIFAGATFLLTVFAVVFVGGKLSQTVEDHGVRLDLQASQLADQGRRLGSTETKVYGLEMYQQGREAVVKESGKH